MKFKFTLSRLPLIRQTVVAAMACLWTQGAFPAIVQPVTDLPAPENAPVPFSPATLSNPVFPAPSADPWVTQHNGTWYAVLAAGGGLQLRTASALSKLSTVKPVCIWHALKAGPLSRDVWAPQMHFLDGRWYLYVTGDDGNNGNHRMWVMEAENPLGPWYNLRRMETGGWAIDGTVLEQNGHRYFIWSGWPGNENVQQNLYISEMQNPWTLTAPRVLLTQPDRQWERLGLPICEAPEVLRHDGRTFIVYSASASWTDDYCLGLLVNDGGDFLNPRSWIKHGPVFKKTEEVWGIGHCCFVQRPSPDHPLDLIFYHAKTKHTPGWDDRNVRVQPFGWSADGLPVFGEPVNLSSRARS